MVGTMLKNMLDEREMSVSELSRLSGIPAQTLFSIIKRDNMRVGFDALIKICETLEVPIDVFYSGDPASSGVPDKRERSLLTAFRDTDEHGRRLIELVAEAELNRTLDTGSK